ncbi:MAG: choice-of-anchor L domain-containing protein, partial [Planctomycetes bacterium]|nr:choice-of-anchor L domain-containing protein [Planctomycetota bacterium]
MPYPSSVDVTYSLVGPPYSGEPTDDLDVLGEVLTVEPTDDPDVLVSNILGSGITVSNLAFTGSASSAGTFSGGIAAGLGIESGIILTCGDATIAPGADPLQPGVNFSDSASSVNALPGDDDLTELIDVVTNDATVLEFDFISKGGDLYFSYIFASEEYNEFVYSFNDVFAFFLDGENIAVIPGTSMQVSVDSINGGNPYGYNASNPQLYNNNDLNDEGPFFANEYDGFTHVLVAQAKGLSAGTHHIKLAIADAWDSAFDSAVFIRADSFSDIFPSGPPISVQPGSTIPFWNPESRSGDPNVIVWDASRFNLSENPYFISDYFLCQEVAGQILQSPCIDAGDP